MGELSPGLQNLGFFWGALIGVFEFILVPYTLTVLPGNTPNILPPPPPWKSYCWHPYLQTNKNYGQDCQTLPLLPKPAAEMRANIVTDVIRSLREKF